MTHLQKVLIIGSGGAGKSTLARTLGEITGLPVYHLDSLFWHPGWVETSNDEWDKQVRDLVHRDAWILDGNYSRTLDIRTDFADTVIFLDFPRWLTTYRIIKRRIQHHGTTRPDMREGCPEKLDFEFVRWVWNYPRDKRPKILAKLAKLPTEKRVVILRSRSEVQRFIRSVRQYATR